jgi:hypothetical protein
MDKVQKPSDSECYTSSSEPLKSKNNMHAMKLSLICNVGQL